MATAIASVDPTIARFREVLDYDPATGAFTWKIRMGKSRPGEAAGTIWKCTYTGRAYRKIGIDRHKWRANVIAFAIMSGAMPVGEVDHADGNSLNDRWNNLRDSSKSQNQANAKLRSDSKTGAKGVQFRPGLGWIARIQHQKVRHHLGVFRSREDAAQAYSTAATDLFGPFARPIS